MQRILTITLLLTLFPALSREKINIWPAGHAELEGVEAKQIPTLDLYPVKSEKPAPAVLIIPGGGYKHHSSSAWAQAKHCQQRGIAAFVVRYRLPAFGYQHPTPLHDAQRALRLIHHNAQAWKLDDSRIGVIGSSSGGHLASLLCNRNDAGDAEASDPVNVHGCRPAFAILMSPVITFLKPHAHWPSRVRMLGQAADDEQAAALSPERLVSKNTPPTVLIHGDADTLVVPENSQLYLAACKTHDVSAELVLIPGMNHVGAGPELTAKRDAAFDRALTELTATSPE